MACSSSGLVDVDELVGVEEGSAELCEAGLFDGAACCEAFGWRWGAL